MVGFFFLRRTGVALVEGDAGGKFVATYQDQTQFSNYKLCPLPPPEVELRKYLDYGILLLFCGAATYYSFPFPENTNGTHEVHTWVFHQPKNLEQLENVVKEANLKKTWIRHFRSGAGMVNLALMDKVLEHETSHSCKGTIEFSKEKDPKLFYLAGCGLRSLGVVAEVTILCIERQELAAHTTISNMEEIKKNHKKLLFENKHVKYMYIPYTDVVVVVVNCNLVSKWRGSPKSKPKYTVDEAMQPIQDLYKDSLKKYRDKLLTLDPLNKVHVIKVNQAEADFLRKSEGFKVGWSDEILGFDCGGQQWVSETCFPAGTIENVPAPTPIEQHWIASNRSLMSSASSSSEDDIFSWHSLLGAPLYEFWFIIFEFLTSRSSILYVKRYLHRYFHLDLFNFL
ncbi:hypothetical protein UlMin_020282 [Ulmus minor]